ncbi:MAG: amidohydrolase family protein [Clostridia bacterium]|nr:amidohydrolase family protein [Clostridia bacterium]
MKIALVLTAAGMSKRFGSDKLAYPIDGKPMLLHALELYDWLRDRFVSRTVVLREGAEERRMVAERMEYRVVENPDPERGIASSVVIGTQDALKSDPDAILYAVGDQPRVTETTVLKLLNVFTENPTCIVAPVGEGRRGNPVVFPKDLFPELLALSGDVGGSQVIRKHPDRVVTVEVPAAELYDVDVRGTDASRHTVLHGNVLTVPKLGELDAIRSGYVVLDGDGVIEGVFETLPERYRNAQLADYGDALIMQSFCDMHLHAPQYPMLGMGMDLPLLDWLHTYTFRTEAAFKDPDYARRHYRALAERLIGNGTTRVCMFSSLHTDATLILMEELERAGVSGFVGKVNMDRNSPDYYCETAEESKRETLRWLDACDRFSLVRPILTPRFTPSCSDELMAWLGRIANERNLPVQSHLSENTSEIELVRSLHPDCAQYWETYHKYGLWKRDTLMAHCVHSDEREREAIKAHGVTVVHCADSNTNLSSGVAPIRTMLDEGIKVVLGSDIAGGAHLSMLNVIQMSIRASKIKRIESEWTIPFLSVAEGYYLGTTAGAAYFGAKPGFQKGDKLHAVVIDDREYPDTERLTLRERFDRAVYIAEPKDIVAVYAEGKRRK